MNAPRRSGAAALTEWTRRIAEDEMPIFSRTVQRIVSLAEQDDISSAQLAQVILEDASMTARVLKLANTIIYNPRTQRISTVSRAVVVLGFNVVRNLCLSIALVDALVQGMPQERLIQELARALHAAVQARHIAVVRRDDSPEEVFIATLLYHLGELAFWCFGGQRAEELDSALRQEGVAPEQAQEQVLGFRLQQLTESLAREWNLNELLNAVVKNPGRLGDRGRNITLAYQLATAAERGWRDEGVQEVIRLIAQLIKESEIDTRALLHNNAHEAQRMAGFYGAAIAAEVIPVPGSLLGEEEGAGGEGEPGVDPETCPKPDSMLQLRILRELAQVLEGKPNLNLVMELVMEGIYRGVGMDRTLFALVTPDRRGLRAKFMLGQGQEALLSRFHFARHPEHTNVLFQALDRQEPLWVDTGRHPELRPLVTPGLVEVLGRKPFLLGPIMVNNLSIGLFVADRTLSGRAIDDEAFEAFRYFVLQANMGLGYAASRRKQK